ncbi:hypothetical protein Tco_0728683 [Tanacetum coccineum]|uniref:Retrovirus-related Pol polyprotein from transposon TNT 1-94 n=1 Tax=Tanacetum coccineum TaxID=301880 RepID=A0ABQ4YPH8_9ASTR
MAAGQRKPETQWTPEERKAANLDQRIKSFIMFVLLDDQMNSVINCLTAKSTWDDLILYHEGPSDVKESRVMDLKLCYNTFKFKEGESLAQTFTRYKALMNELVNDGIKLSKLEINIGFINELPKKWLAFCQRLKNTNHVKESELASLFSKLKYEENLINVLMMKRIQEEVKSTCNDIEENTKEVSSDDNEVTKAKALMALVDEDSVFVGKESARNGEWIKISMKKAKRSHVYKVLSRYSEVSITGSNKPKLSEAKISTLSNHDTGKVPSNESQRNTTDHLVVVSDSSATDYDSADESLSTFKAKTLKGIIINEPSLAPARGNKSSLASKTNSTPAGKLKNVKIERFNPPLAMYHTSQGESSSRSRPLRPAVPFPSYIHYGYNDHKSNDCVYYPICEICRSYDYDTHGHNRIISLRRGIKPRNPQYVTKNYETCGSNVHTTSDHNDIEWLRKKEALQAKKVESFKASKTESSSALRLKTPTKRSLNSYPLQMEDTSSHDTIPILFNKEGTWHCNHKAIMLDLIINCMKA